MNSASVANKLGQATMPGIAARILPDTMNVVVAATSQDEMGGERNTESTAYSAVPCSASPIRGDREESASRLAAVVRYRVSFPTHLANGTRINIDSRAHRLVVLARGNEPQRLMRILAIEESSGVMFYAVCEKED